MDWIEVKVKTKKENEDIVSTILYELGAEGLSIEDPQDILDLHENKDSWELMDINIIDSNIEDIVINAYYLDNEETKIIIENAKKRIETIPLEEDGEELGILETKGIDDRDWSECWKKYYKPLEIGKNIVIKPTWEEYELSEGQILIEIDPGMAFGTGTHETTEMCSEILEEYINEDDIVYDIGIGSGILSIIAAKLGAKEVVGVDIDPLCIEVSNENIKLNKVEDIVIAKRGDLLDVIEDKADIIVSNILAEIITKMVPDVSRHLKDKGILITSGIIQDKVGIVEKSLIENHYEIIDIRRKGEWVAIISRRS